MGVVEDQWPKLHMDRSLAAARSPLTARAPRAKTQMRNGNSAGGIGEASDRNSEQIEAILKHLEAADLERHELVKDARWLNVRVLTLEQTLRLAVEANETILNSLQSCFREIREHEDRLSPRLEQLEADAVEFASQIAQTNQDMFATRIESQTSSSQVNERLAEMLDWLHETQLTAMRATGSVDITVAQMDQLAIDLRGVQAKVSTLSELPDGVASMSDELSSLADGVAAAAERTEQVDGRLTSRLANFAGELAEVSQQTAELSETTHQSPALAADFPDLAAIAVETAESKRTVSDLAAELRAGMERARLVEERLSVDIAEVTGDIATVSAELEVVARQSELSNNMATRVSADVAAVAESLTTAASDISDMSEAVASHEQQINSIETDLSTTRENSAEQIDELTSYVRAAAGLAKQAQATAHNATTSVDVTRERLVAEMAEVTSDVDAVAENLTAATLDISDISEAVASHEQQIGADAVRERVSAEIAEVTSDIAAVSNKMTAVEERVEESETRMTVRISDVSTEVTTVAAGISNVSSAAEESNREIVELTAALSAAKDSSARELQELAREVRSTADLAREAQTTAYKAKDRAEHSASSAEELRADFDAEADKSDSEAALEDTRTRLAIALKRLDELEAQAQQIQGTVDSAELETLRTEVELSTAAIRWLIDDLLNGERAGSPVAEADPSERHRVRWDQHLQHQAELRQQRSTKNEHPPKR